MPSSRLTAARQRALLAVAMAVLIVPALAGVTSAATPDGTAAAQPELSNSTAVIASVASVRATGGEDTDGDALLDVWETEGYDADDDGIVDVDLPAMGADPLHKDVFVEMDYMGAESACPCHLPLKPDLRRIVKSFKRSPNADNPDGEKGIRIHLDAGSARGLRYNLGGGNLVPHDTDLNPYQTEFAALKAVHFNPDRARIFHYMIWAHNYNGGSSSGVSFGIPADSFLVTLGSWPEHGSSNAKVGTFIHELGHNLGLGHGGFESRNYKPNYLSVMSYAFQIEGVPLVAGGGYFGYSRSALPTLTESALVEADGLGHADAEKFRTSWWCSGGLVTSPGSAADPLDWNCNGTIGGTVSVDVNSDGGLTTLVGSQDWGNLVYNGGTIGLGATAPGSPDQVDELTLEEHVSHQH